MTLTLLYILELAGLSIEVYFILIIISIPAFLFWRRLFKKFIKKDRTRRITTWAITLITAPLIYMGLIQFLISVITFSPTKDFNKSQWLTDKKRRFQMAGHIINSNMLIGKDTNQVKQILGYPTRRSNSTNQAEFKNSWSYDMGMGDGGLSFMFHNLIVKFDSYYKVIKVEHATIQD